MSANKLVTAWEEMCKVFVIKIIFEIPFYHSSYFFLLDFKKTACRGK